MVFLATFGLVGGIVGYSRRMGVLLGFCGIINNWLVWNLFETCFKGDCLRILSYPS